MAKPKVSLLERMFFSVLFTLAGLLAFIQILDINNTKSFLGIPIIAIGGIGVIIYFVWWILRENPSHSK